MKINRSGKFLIIAQSISSLGDWFTFITVGIIIYYQTKSAANLALWVVCTKLPYVVFNFLAGPLSDIFSKKMIMISSDILRAILACLFILTITPNSNIYLIYLLYFIRSTISCFHKTAAKSIIVDITSSDYEISKINSLNYALWFIVSIIAGIVSTYFSTYFLPIFFFIADAITFIISATFTYFIKQKQHIRNNKKELTFFESITDFKQIKKNHLLVSYLIDYFTVIFISTPIVLFQIALPSEMYHVSKKYIYIFATAYSIGSALAAITITFLFYKLKETLIAKTLIVTSIVIICMFFSKNYFHGILLFGLFSYLTTFLTIIIENKLILACSLNSQGRMNAFKTSMSMLIVVSVNPIFGTLSKQFGIQIILPILLIVIITYVAIKPLICKTLQLKST